MSLIYKIIAFCPKTNKTFIYIGRTNRTLEERKREHERGAAQNRPEPLYQMLRKIPLDDCIYESLVECSPAEAAKQESRMISMYRDITKNDPNMIILNDTEYRETKTEKTSSSPNFGIPKTNKHKNFSKSDIGRKFLMDSGKLKPVINLKTGRTHDSISMAARIDGTRKTAIKNSCETGRKLSDGTQYAYIDLDSNPTLLIGHSQDHYIGNNARKIKELMSGRILDSTKKASKEYNVSASRIGESAKDGAIVLNQYVFSYLDKDGSEVRTPEHDKAIEKIKKKEQYNYVAWPVDFMYEEAIGKNKVAYFRTLGELYEKLKIKNKSHVKAVCDGERSHVETLRIAFYNHETRMPILTEAHLKNSKKIIRKIQCLNDKRIFDHCTDAGYTYSVAPNQIGMCARGILKSVRVKNKETGKTERFRFAYLDAVGQPIIKSKHNEPLSQRKGISRIHLINQEAINYLGQSTFGSLAEYCRVTGVGPKRAKKYRQDSTINLMGYEFIELD